MKRHQQGLVWDVIYTKQHLLKGKGSYSEVCCKHLDVDFLIQSSLMYLAIMYLVSSLCNRNIMKPVSPHIIRIRLSGTRFSISAAIFVERMTEMPGNLLWSFGSGLRAQRGSGLYKTILPTASIKFPRSFAVGWSRKLEEDTGHFLNRKGTNKLGHLCRLGKYAYQA